MDAVNPEKRTYIYIYRSRVTEFRKRKITTINNKTTSYIVKRLEILPMPCEVNFHTQMNSKHQEIFKNKRL